MKRRDFIKVTGIGVAGAATMAAPAIAQSMPEIKWRMTTSWGPFDAQIQNRIRSLATTTFPE
jgi:TRAP-type mannitol/chloroaromatic compound transport system substrate-binding protein